MISWSFLNRRQLKDIHNDKRNVILLAHGRRSPPLEFGEHLM